MRKLLPFLLLLLPLAADICVAQTSQLNIVCADCRDPNRYPDDFVNFAFNQAYGPGSWLTFDQADDFYITNLDKQTVYVDIDFVFLGFGFQGLELPFWPTHLLKFTLALPNGSIYTVLRSKFLTPLPVPSSDDGDPGSSDGGTGGDDDDYGFDDWDETEYDGYEGTTGIEDPDEYGNFADPDWCEEC
jgi:hypothetical protein